MKLEFLFQEIFFIWPEHISEVDVGQDVPKVSQTDESPTDQVKLTVGEELSSVRGTRLDVAASGPSSHLVLIRCSRLS